MLRHCIGTQNTKEPMQLLRACECKGESSEPTVTISTGGYRLVSLKEKVVALCSNIEVKVG